MGWSTVYLIIGILAGILGIWNLARQRNIFLALTGIVWFLVVLFMFFVEKVYNYEFLSGVPAVGNLMTYVLVPVLLILAFFSGGTRR